eukprot:179324_1
MSGFDTEMLQNHTEMFQNQFREIFAAVFSVDIDSIDQSLPSSDDLIKLSGLVICGIALFLSIYGTRALKTISILLSFGVSFTATLYGAMLLFDKDLINNRMLALLLVLFPLVGIIGGWMVFDFICSVVELMVLFFAGTLGLAVMALAHQFLRTSTFVRGQSVEVRALRGFDDQTGATLFLSAVGLSLLLAGKCVGVLLAIVIFAATYFQLYTYVPDFFQPLIAQIEQIFRQNTTITTIPLTYLVVVAVMWLGLMYMVKGIRSKVLPKVLSLATGALLGYLGVLIVYHGFEITKKDSFELIDNNSVAYMYGGFVFCVGAVMQNCAS